MIATIALPWRLISSLTGRSLMSGGPPLTVSLSQGPVAGSGVALQHELARAVPLRGDWRAAAFVDLGVARLAQAARPLAGAAVGVQARRGAMSVEVVLAAPWRSVQGGSAAPVCSASVTAHF